MKRPLIEYTRATEDPALRECLECHAVIPGSTGNIQAHFNKGPCGEAIRKRESETPFKFGSVVVSLGPIQMPSWEAPADAPEMPVSFRVAPGAMIFLTTGECLEVLEDYPTITERYEETDDPGAMMEAVVVKTLPRTNEQISYRKQIRKGMVLSIEEHSGELEEKLNAERKAQGNGNPWAS